MRYLRFIAPLLLVAAVDLMFQLGAWEPMASPESHAGMSVVKKRAVEDPAFRHIDFVTLGDSRAVYGIDHSALASAAAARGQVHANMSVAGMHWMSLGVMLRWLGRHHPELRGGVIALSAQAFLAPGNGSYELGIAYPFRTFADVPDIVRHVPFQWRDPATYGDYSGLFQYHEDVQDFLAHPQRRRDLLGYFRSLAARDVLENSVDGSGDMCATPMDHLADCAETPPAGKRVDSHFAEQCRLLQSQVGAHYDLRPYLNGEPLTDHLRETRDLIRAELRGIRWPRRPVFVLMPMLSVWGKDVLPDGAHEWALSVLAPLANSGEIRLLDYTDLFAGGNGGECSVFFDVYHNNVAGRQELMRALLPEVDRYLFDASEDGKPERGSTGEQGQ